MNHELAAVVLDKIQSYPGNFDMGAWFDSQGPYHLTYTGPDPSKTDVECGTTFCVAGWVDMITTGRVSLDQIQQRAREALGISHDLAALLFHAYSEEKAIAALEVMSKPDTTEADVWREL